MFAALSVESALRYSSKFRPTEGSPSPDRVRGFEVFASQYTILDMHHLDLTHRPELLPSRYQAYWAGQVSFDALKGVWREPLLEALLPLPARVGSMVLEVEAPWKARAGSQNR